MGVAPRPATASFKPVLGSPCESLGTGATLDVTGHMESECSATTTGTVLRYWPTAKRLADQLRLSPEHFCRVEVLGFLV